MENDAASPKQLVIDDQIKHYLLESSRWSKFLAIVGYVGLGLLFLMCAVMILGLTLLSPMAKGTPMVAMGFVYLLVGVLYYFPITYLYRFSRYVRLGVLAEDELLISNAFYHLKKMFKFIGIVTLVILSLYVLILVIAVPMFLLKAF
ncbi:MAG: hypothetical protein LWW85_03560 [Marinilabiliales bacterium]|nr:hypothetical protein [Marinilabiliales bacterium]